MLETNHGSVIDLRASPLVDKGEWARGPASGDEPFEFTGEYCDEACRITID
jgi:hypothetical protein